MNKAERFRRKMLKYKKRIKHIGIDESTGKFYAYRSHGKPCSCWICSTPKYKRAQKHKPNFLKELY